MYAVLPESHPAINKRDFGTSGSSQRRMDLVFRNDFSPLSMMPFQNLLQPPTHAYRTGRANAGSVRVTTNCQSPLISLAASLPILISDGNGGLTVQRLGLTGHPVNLRKKPESNHPVFAFLVAARFADPIVSLPPYQFARDRVLAGYRGHQAVLNATGALFHQSHFDCPLSRLGGTKLTEPGRLIGSNLP